jgi:hypothetical protein
MIGFLMRKGRAANEDVAQTLSTTEQGLLPRGLPAHDVGHCALFPVGNLSTTPKNALHRSQIPLATNVLKYGFL